MLPESLLTIQGSHYCARDYGPSARNSNTYHHPNLDGSYSYSSPNRSTYYNNGKGYPNYTPPSGSSGSSDKK
ncbi:hypothetical protein N7532_006556 [Penicillium argentinense]|uniref:Uncharacterized protein n=1 Tax=Penicillium argentinense TaxID=1131581 RepID=A0A9W9KAY9_9EURO|nr:uncharacterized protein N7532_006556 [Penicillium argentinense]KAJ5099555.1 hypothetical protein N7532_006556 [Penicillium argentinense]